MSEAIAKDTGKAADRQEREVFIEKGETKRVTFQLSIDRSKDYEPRVDAKYAQ